MNKVLYVLAALAVTSAVLAATPAHASGSSCPRGQRLRTVELATEPYSVDNAVDERGNDDGWARYLPDSQES